MHASACVFASSFDNLSPCENKSLHTKVFPLLSLLTKLIGRETQIRGTLKRRVNPTGNNLYRRARVAAQVWSHSSAARLLLQVEDHITNDRVIDLPFPSVGKTKTGLLCAELLLAWSQ